MTFTRIPYTPTPSIRRPLTGTTVDSQTRSQSPAATLTGHSQNGAVCLNCRRRDGSDSDQEKQSVCDRQEHETGSDLVDWDGPDDPENPQNLPFKRKLLMTAVAGLCTFTVSFDSSIFSTSIEVTAAEFDVSPEIMILGVSLYVLGFAAGPLIWGPFSEISGRTRPLFIGFFLFAIFQIPVAVARNVETILICRFFAGAAGVAPLAIVGGMLVDIWATVERAVAYCVYVGFIFLGPVLGPIIGNFITQSYLGWRWTAWVTLIVAAVFGPIAFVCLPETYPPVLLQRRAAKVRHQTKRWAYHSKLDESPITVQILLRKYLSRPIVMLFSEPIVSLIMTPSSIFDCAYQDIKPR